MDDRLQVALLLLQSLHQYSAAAAVQSRPPSSIDIRLTGTGRGQELEDVTALPPPPPPPAEDDRPLPAFSTTADPAFLTRTFGGNSVTALGLTAASTSINRARPPPLVSPQPSQAEEERGVKTTTVTAALAAVFGASRRSDAGQLQPQQGELSEQQQKQQQEEKQQQGLCASPSSNRSSSLSPRAYMEVTAKDEGTVPAARAAPHPPLYERQASISPIISPAGAAGEATRRRWVSGAVGREREEEGEERGKKEPSSHW